MPTDFQPFSHFDLSPNFAKANLNNSHWKIAYYIVIDFDLLKEKKFFNNIIDFNLF